MLKDILSLNMKIINKPLLLLMVINNLIITYKIFIFILEMNGAELLGK
jgi:hypothetical protein